MEKFIEAKNITFSYVNEMEDPPIKTTVFENLSLEIKKGEFIAILGHNGSGKSTLAKCFNAINIPEEGDVFVNGMSIKDQSKILDIRQSVGMVFQNPDNQIVATVVEEDVAFALENMGVPSEEIRRRVDESLKTVGMYEYREHAPHKLSGGQKQRVAIAGILAMQPDCILLDEPTAMLDPKGRREVLKTVKELNKNKGVTIVLITHYMDEAAQADDTTGTDNAAMDGEATDNRTTDSVMPESVMPDSVMSDSVTTDSVTTDSVMADGQNAVTPDADAETSTARQSASASDSSPQVQEALARPESYQVQKGDSLIAISRRFYGTDEKVIEICRLNNIKDPNQIQPGQNILLPSK